MRKVQIELLVLLRAALFYFLWIPYWSYICKKKKKKSFYSCMRTMFIGFAAWVNMDAMEFLIFWPPHIVIPRARYYRYRSYRVDRLIFGLSRRSISMRIIDCHTNSITWLRSRPCKFSWAGSATGYANSSEKRENYAGMCDCSTRLETHYDLWIIIAPNIFSFIRRVTPAVLPLSLLYF